MKKIEHISPLSIGIEFGSTRIKAVAIDPQGKILATGGFDWENHFIDGIWTYPLDEIILGLQSAYRSLAEDMRKHHLSVDQVRSLGISGMMHGYLPFDKNGQLLVPFRTWRNNTTLEASHKLTQLFQHNIPQRWSIAHLYQAILNQESHIHEIDYLTTLSGFIHWQLTGERVIGIGEGSGMFPISIEQQDYDSHMLAQFNTLLPEHHIHWQVEKILPKVLNAGQYAGLLTDQGAKLIDPTGTLPAGIPLCPPEGDAGTGMVATNSVQENTGNISAGTSAFAMIVLEKPLSQVYDELDMVTTPAGKLVAMAHSNNCSSHLNAWIGLFRECLNAFGMKVENNKLYETLFLQSLQGDPDAGKLLSYGFYSGEHNLGLSAGCPMFIYPTSSNFNLANFIRVQLYTAFGSMKLGMDILQEKERVKISRILAHGGIFKTRQVAQQILASALDVPIATMASAGEGGAWGIALLADYLHFSDELSLEQYLAKNIFANAETDVVQPDEGIKQGYQQFMRQYQHGLSIVQEAVKIQ